MDKKLILFLVFSLPAWGQMLKSVVSSRVSTSIPPIGAVTFDATGPAGGTAAEHSGNGGASAGSYTLSWSHPGVASGTNRAVFVACTLAHSNTTGLTFALGSATYGGSAMTSISATHTEITNSGNDYGGTQIYGLALGSGSTLGGTQTVNVTLNYGAGTNAVVYDFECGSVTFTGTHQTTTWQNAVTNSNITTGSALATVNVTTAANDVVINLVDLGQPEAGSAPLNSGTVIVKYMGTASWGWMGFQYQTGSSPVTATWKLTADLWASAGLDVVHD